MKVVRLIILLLVPMMGTATDRYVSLTGSSASPYTSWATAATSIHYAVSVANAGDYIYVTNQTRYLMTNELAVDKAITIRSWNGTSNALDRDTTIIDANNYTGKPVTNRCVNMTADAALMGLTFRGGSTVNILCGGAGVYMNAGRLDHCIVISNTCEYTIYGGARGCGVSLEGGQLNDCVICDNKQYHGTGGGYGSGGAGIYIKGAATAVSNCTIRGNYLDGAGLMFNGGGGVCMLEGLLSRCVIEDNILTNSGAYTGGAGVFAWGGEVAYCTVTGNVAYSSGADGAGVHWSAGRHGWAAWSGLGAPVNLHDCTIVNNMSMTGSGGGVMLRDRTTNGVMANCIVRGNFANRNGGGIEIDATTSDATDSNPDIRNCLIAYNNAGAGGSHYGGGVHAFDFDGTISTCTIVSNVVSFRWGGIRMDDTCSMLNCIVSSNRCHASYPLDQNLGPVDCVSYSCSPVLTAGVNGNITNYPGFVDFANEDFRLSGGSSSVNAGTNETWMTGAKDLDGHARVDFFKHRVDMGAYEHVCRGTMFLFYGDSP